ncbi:MFS transporter [Nafulsella turpanensis]|uniref:MFS transporter n=1 Tax=Nafulsella turpanensis TaxID=1265690 RepID=UPI000344E2CA|nr:MFS transporter [Nafulsella turpanensis]
MGNDWSRLIGENRHLIIFGFLMTFFSSFGQTFMVSIYVPEILQAFELSNASFGSIYAAATLLSALCLTWAGRFIDLIDLKKFTWLVVGGMVVSLLVFSQARHIVLLVIGLWGIRLSGQGLMSHTAITTMGRYFDHVRGKAISITTLGHPAGSAAFPVLIAFSISFIGWRSTLLASAALVAFLLPPAIAYLLRNQQTDPAAFRKEEEEKPAVKTTERTISYQTIIRNRYFWLIAPGTMALPLLNTALFFYQIAIGNAKGWTTEWVAASFIAYAVASAFCTLVAGQLVDRLSAKKLFPFYLFPLLLGILLLITSSAIWVPPVYLTLMGISSGFGNTTKSALQAEAFGIEYLGTVRSLFTALMVISTAIGPAAFGLLLDGGFSFEEVLMIAAVYLSLTILWNFRILFAKPAAS